MQMLIIVFKIQPEGLPLPMLHRAKDFSLSAEGYNSALAILAPLAEDKLHINYSDIIPFFTSST